MTVGPSDKTSAAGHWLQHTRGGCVTVFTACTLTEGADRPRCNGVVRGVCQAIRKAIRSLDGKSIARRTRTASKRQIAAVTALQDSKCTSAIGRRATPATAWRPKVLTSQTLAFSSALAAAAAIQRRWLAVAASVRNEQQQRGGQASESVRADQASVAHRSSSGLGR